MKAYIAAASFFAWCWFLLDQTDAGQPGWIDYAIPLTLAAAVTVGGLAMSAITKLPTPTVFKDEK